MTIPIRTLRRAASLAAFVLLAAAGCHDVTAPVPATTGLVSISLKLGPTTADGTPIAVTVTNNGTAAVFLARQCNIILMLQLQRYQNGEWQWIGPAIACPVYPDIGPITLAPGESLQAASTAFGPGRYRVAVFASPSTDLSSAAMVSSGEVAVP
jgi:hypothetical protein